MSIYTRFAGTFLLLLIGAQLPLLGSAQSAPVLSHAKAIQIASSFCKSVGAPVTGTPTTQFPAPPRYTSQQDPHWQAHWRIKFGDDAEVEVIDATGVVSRYFNFQLTNQSLKPGTPVAKPMSETQALQRANAVLKASGQTGELATPTAFYQQTSYPPTSDGQEWVVTWKRQFQKIPYRSQQATLLLQADNGEVQGFSIAFNTPAPKAGPGAVTRAQAQTTANAQMATVGKPYTALEAPQLQVVQPNKFWQTGDEEPQAGVSKVVWICFFAQANSRYEVWVDSTSGKVIGADVSMSR